MLTPEELRRYRKKYDDNYNLYEEVSNYIMKECIGFQNSHPKVVRVICSRQPKVKTFLSIQNKIEDKRKNEDPNYSYDDLPDIIALTVLCPYRKDVDGKDGFNGWLNKSFRVHNPKDAFREYPSGHRGYHFVVSVRDETARVFPKYKSVKCEIQVKTILEEAFDAKTHDLTYKELEGRATEELKNQFAILSRSLKSIDEHTEFLRDLILEEEKELGLRRQACVILFLTSKPTKAIGKQLSVSLDKIKPGDATWIAEKIEALASRGISKYLCGFTALCALKLNDEYLKGEALSYAKRFIENSGRNWESYMVQASIEWAPDEFEESINHVRVPLGLRQEDTT